MNGSSSPPMVTRVDSTMDFFSMVKTTHNHETFFELLVTLQCDRLEAQRASPPNTFKAVEFLKKSPEGSQPETKTHNKAKLARDRSKSPQPASMPSSPPPAPNTPLEDTIYYAGRLNRAEAEEILEYYKDGTFLVRIGEKGPVLSVRWSKSGAPGGFCTHVKIEDFKNEGRVYFRMCAVDKFAAVTELVDYYVAHPAIFAERFWPEATNPAPALLQYDPELHGTQIAADKAARQQAIQGRHLPPPPSPNSLSPSPSPSPVPMRSALPSFSTSPGLSPPTTPIRRAPGSQVTIASSPSNTPSAPPLAGPNHTANMQPLEPDYEYNTRANTLSGNVRQLATPMAAVGMRQQASDGYEAPVLCFAPPTTESSYEEPVVPGRHQQHQHPAAAESSYEEPVVPGRKHHPAPAVTIAPPPRAVWAGLGNGTKVADPSPKRESEYSVLASEDALSRSAGREARRDYHALQRGSLGSPAVDSVYEEPVVASK